MWLPPPGLLPLQRGLDAAIAAAEAEDVAKAAAETRAAAAPERTQLTWDAPSHAVAAEALLSADAMLAATPRLESVRQAHVEVSLDGRSRRRLNTCLNCCVLVSLHFPLDMFSTVCSFVNMSAWIYNCNMGVNQGAHAEVILVQCGPAQSPVKRELAIGILECMFYMF